MNNRTFSGLIIILLMAVCVISSTAAASPDINPPFWRGEEGTTFQLWNFSDTANPSVSQAQPSGNPYGTPTAKIEYSKPFVPWIPLDHGHDGVWYVEAHDWITLQIPDSQDPDPTRQLYLQMIFYTAAGISGQNLVIRPETADLQVITEEYLPDDEYYMYGSYLITLQADSPLLQLQIAPKACTMYIDSIAVDVIPEPMTMGLFGLGSMIIFARRKR